MFYLSENYRKLVRIVQAYIKHNIYGIEKIHNIHRFYFFVNVLLSIEKWKFYDLKRSCIWSQKWRTDQHAWSAHFLEAKTIHLIQQGHGLRLDVLQPSWIHTHVGFSRGPNPTAVMCVLTSEWMCVKSMYVCVCMCIFVLTHYKGIKILKKTTQRKLMRKEKK